MGDPQFQPLKTFLVRDSKKFLKHLLAQTYVVAEGKVVLAYATLICGEITAEIETADPDGAEFRYEHYPAVKIARLAVDRRYRKHGLGTKLVEFSVGRALEISGIAGCRYVVVDARRQSVNFYERQGFRLIDTNANRELNEPVMFLGLSQR